MAGYSKIEKAVDSVAGTIWDVASNVWELAELSYKEFKSSALIGVTLKNNGFTISDRATGGVATSFVASWGSGSPVLGILVEYDALPGLGNDIVPKQTPAKSGNPNGHGCGHNLIASTSVGAAIALKNHMEKEGIPGTLKVFGCAAEEALNGKNYMAAAGAFDGLDACLHNHPAPVNVAGNVHTTASIDLWVEWSGVTAHAGNSPWDGRSALHAAEIFLVAANMMREQMVPTARLHYQILEGGLAVNVIPDYAKVLVRYRGPSADDVLEHKAWLEDMAKGAALATQTKAKVTNLGGIYDLLPNDVLAERITDHMSRYFPIEWTKEEQNYAKSIQKEMGKPQDGLATSVMPVPKGIEVGGSTDVGDVSWNVPTMGLIYSAWPQHISAHQWGCTACHGMSIGHKATIAAAKTLAAMGLDLLTDRELLNSAQRNFAEKLNGKTYKSMNDFKKNPMGKLHDSEVHQYDCAIHAAMELWDADEHKK